MRTIHLASGAGGMYCGSCLHENTLASALLDAGEDVFMVPLYTPIRTDERSVSSHRVAFGGINVYLQQRWALFRHTPWFLDRLLDRPALLRWLAARSSTVRPEQLGQMTVSMLRGEDGRQRKELEKLIRWLATQPRPDLIHLSNVMLCGLARQLTQRLNVPVVATLSGEDVFLEKLPEPYYTQARDVLRERAADLAGMVALNGYYADFMADYLDVERSRIEVVRPGLNLAGHGWRPQCDSESPSPPAPLPASGARGERSRAGNFPAGGARGGDSPRGSEASTHAVADAVAAVVRIGFLARICPEKGLHQLVEAACLLAADADGPKFELHAAGFLDDAERPYLEQIKRRLDASGLADRFAYHGELDRPGKIAFLQSLDLMCLPTVYRESKGLSVLEAWANGVPVVVPAHGTFPELIEDTGGGLLCPPEDPAALAAALGRMAGDRDLAAEHGRRGHEAVHQRYRADVMAQNTIQWYGRVLAGGSDHCTE